ncbi:perforin-1-like [Xiphophorus couchianus]|uniref:perforin-1-like n=1 Tax=Xiphophorus couchianus TaxID=32473 RepID=UPI001015EEB2|nr:perforin-1-like [Xiphophorus couchianus]
MLPDSTSALLLLSVLLVHSSVLSCRIGTQSECDAAPFVPGYNLVGEGYDIVRLQRKGAYVIDVKTYLSSADSCTLCSNPLQNHAYQKLPSSVVDWRAINRCTAEISSSHHTSASSLIQAYTSHDTNDWSFGLDVQNVLESGKSDVGGTRSNAYKFASQRSKEDRYTFSTHSITCSHYRFRVSSTPNLSIDFKRQSENLPSHYNSSTADEYGDLINTFGTHYFRLVILGGQLKRLTSSRSCLSSLNGLSSSEVHSCLSMGVAVGLGKTQLTGALKSCKNVLQNQDSSTNFSTGLHQHYTEVSGGDGWLGEFTISKNDSISYTKWLLSLKNTPDVVSFSLRPLYQLVPGQLQKAGMKTAIEQYLMNNAVKKSPQEPHCETTTPNLSSNCCPQQALKGTLSVTIIQGYNISGDIAGRTECFVHIWYGSTKQSTHMVKSNNPKFNENFDFGKVDTNNVLRVEVWDKDLFYDQFLGDCRRNPTPGTHHIKCSIKRGRLEFTYTLTCDPYLTGDRCERYKPSPD